MGNYVCSGNSKIYEKEPRNIETSIVIAKTFCQSLGTSLYRGSTVSNNELNGTIVNPFFGNFVFKF